MLLNLKIRYLVNMLKIRGNSEVLDRRKRDSNMELFRIVATFLILVVHASFFTLGAPTQVDIVANPVSSFTRFFVQAISIVSVNAFVLLSGWFGIRPKASSFLNFVFQILFWAIGIYVICLICGFAKLNISGVLYCFQMRDFGWFIKAYIGLLILAPILNVFIDTVAEKQLRNALIFFYIFQTLYGWFPGGAQFFEFGYSTMSFIGLYLLARYIRLYMIDVVSWNKWFDLLGYFSIVFFIAIVAFVSKRIGVYFIAGKMYDYSSPFVVLAPVFLLLFFSKISFSSKFINWVGVSSFAAFLLHANINILRPFFGEHIRCIYNSFDGVLVLLVVFVYLLIVFLLAVLIDQIRIFFWRRISVLFLK